MSELDIQTQVLACREAGNVQRCHGLPHHGEYSVAHHSWQATVLLMILYPVSVPGDLLKAVMMHDAAERWVGDSPSPALARWPDLGKAYAAAEEQVQTRLLGFRPELDLAPHDYDWLKGVDRLELYLWTEEQLALGNRNAQPWATGLRNQLLAPPTPVEITNFVTNYSWRRTDNQEVMGSL